MFREFARYTVATAVLAWACSGAAGVARAEGSAIILAPHRAVYDFSLGKTRDHSGVVAVAGRMVYELTGSTCEGYTEKLRFVTRITNEDGQEITADDRISTWEEAAGKRFRFNSTEMRDGKSAVDTVGDAVRASTADEIAVVLSKPDKKDLTLPPRVYFPTQHTIALLTAARTGQPSLHADVYDGSEQGEKVYHTVSTIGRSLPRDANQKLASVANTERLRRLAAWPITIAYFDPKLDGQDATPAYEMRAVFFENGVNGVLAIDYGSFAIEGELKEIEFLEPGKCE
jgi:hypothetical protein